MNYWEKSIELHKTIQWKIWTKIKADILTTDDLSTVYSPWVAAPCKEIATDKEKAYDYTLKANTVAVISDGSAVLGLGNIWWIAGLPVMEWKCAMLKRFWWVNGFPIILDTQDTEEIINTIKNIAPTFGGINLEDISAPRCFEIEERLNKELNIPVFHDDQHGTAIVVLAGIINTLRIKHSIESIEWITHIEKQSTKIVVNWLWAAGTAIIKLLNAYWFTNIIVCDSKWIISKSRDNLNDEKKEILTITNPEDISWELPDAVKWRDIFVWVSVAWVLSKEMVQSMNSDPAILAMANPIPEIMPEVAYEAGAKIVATWRSDYPNQLNNVLVFPGLFKWALQNRITDINTQMKINAAVWLASYIEKPSPERIIPNAFDEGVADLVASYVK